MKLYLTKMGVVLLGIFAPIQGMLIACGVLISMDLVTGLLAAHKSGTPITSAGLRRTIVKLFLYELCLMLGYITQHYLMSDAIPIANIISGYIGLTEFLSIVENLNIISGSDILKGILSKLNSANQKEP